jgi:hypothetical protein
MVHVGGMTADGDARGCAHGICAVHSSAHFSACWWRAGEMYGHLWRRRSSPRYGCRRLSAAFSSWYASHGFCFFMRSRSTIQFSHSVDDDGWTRGWLFVSPGDGVAMAVAAMAITATTSGGSARLASPLHEQ